MAYSKELGLDDCVFFTSPKYDRTVIRAWYCRADLFLFPSTFDTNGLVVREAAACELASVLVRGGGHHRREKRLFDRGECGVDGGAAGEALP